MYAYSNPTVYIDLTGYAAGNASDPYDMKATEGRFFSGLGVLATQIFSNDTFARDPSESSSSSVLPILGGIDTRRTPQQDADLSAALDSPVLKGISIVAAIKSGKALGPAIKNFLRIRDLTPKL